MQFQINFETSKDALKLFRKIYPVNLQLLEVFFSSWRPYWIKKKKCMSQNCMLKKF